jgi:hypothetical protein
MLLGHVHLLEETRSWEGFGCGRKLAAIEIAGRNPVTIGGKAMHAGASKTASRANDDGHSAAHVFNTFRIKCFAVLD